MVEKLTKKALEFNKVITFKLGSDTIIKNAVFQQFLSIQLRNPLFFVFLRL